MANYEEWTNKRLERGIKKFEEAVQNDMDDLLEAIQYDLDILLKMYEERNRRQRANTPVQTETEAQVAS